MDKQDTLFGQMALECGYITQDAWIEYIHLQEELSQKGENKSIQDLLRADNIITSEIAEKIQKKLAEQICSQTELGDVPNNTVMEVCNDTNIVAQQDIPDARRSTMQQKGAYQILEKIGRYQILQELGKGGMGVVYKALDPLLKRHVALKLMLKSSTRTPLALQRFLTEAQAIAALNHPNIVAIYDIGELDQDNFYLVMEYVQGQSLAKIMEKEPPMSFRRAIEITCSVAQALHAAHSCNIIHRDIKPANILINANGVAKVTDFGLAKITSEASFSISGQFVGTPYYISPEQIDNKAIDARCDIYSLGVTLYQMLSGHLPYEADSVYALLTARVQKDPPPIETYNANISHPLAKIVHRMMARNPQDRFATAEMLVTDLTSYLRAEQVANDAPKTKKPEKRRRSLLRRMLWLLMFVAAIGFGLHHWPVTRPYTSHYMKYSQAKIKPYLVKIRNFVHRRITVDVARETKESSSQGSSTESGTVDIKDSSGNEPRNSTEQEVKATKRQVILEITSDILPRQKVIPRIATLQGKPIHNMEIEPGKYHLVLSHPGYLPVEMDIEIPAGKGFYTIRQTLSPKPRPIKITVESAITTSSFAPKIYYRRNSDLWSPWAEKTLLLPGTYTFQIEANGYHRLEEVKTIEPGDSEGMMSFKLHPKPAGIIVAINYDVPPPVSHPPLEIALRKESHKTPLKTNLLSNQKGTESYSLPALPFGEYSIHISRDGYFQLENRFSVSPGQDSVELSYNLTSKHRKIASKVRDFKTGVEVSILEIRCQDKEQDDFSLKPGTIRLELLFSEYATINKSFNIPPGDQAFTLEAMMTKLSRYSFIIINSMPKIDIQFYGDDTPVFRHHYQIEPHNNGVQCQIFLLPQVINLRIVQKFLELEIASSELKLASVSLSVSSTLLEQYLDRATPSKEVLDILKISSTNPKISAMLLANPDVREIITTYLEKLNPTNDADKRVCQELIEIFSASPGEIKRDEWKQIKAKYLNVRLIPVLQKLRKKQFSLKGINNYNYLEFVHQKTGMVFVLLPGGTFQMGSYQDNSEQPIHEVKLSLFLMARYEVTRGVWSKFMSEPVSFDKYGADHPIHNVTWDKAKKFCDMVELELPTEAEWEYACRGGATTEYYWGQQPDERYLWCESDKKFAKTGWFLQPVGNKLPNEYGLYDMLGNVAEWCHDVYDSYPKISQENPEGPTEKQWRNNRVVRGGSYLDFASHSRCATRRAVRPDFIGEIGVRPVCRIR